MNNNLKPVA